LIKFIYYRIDVESLVGDRLIAVSYHAGFAISRYSSRMSLSSVSGI